MHIAIGKLSLYNLVLIIARLLCRDFSLTASSHQFGARETHFGSDEIHRHSKGTWIAYSITRTAILIEFCLHGPVMFTVTCAKLTVLMTICLGHAKEDAALRAVDTLC